MEAFCLKPIDAGHGSWDRSSVKSQIAWVRLLANDRTDARTKCAKATLVHIGQTPGPRYTTITFPKSPWELPDVTSCEPDRSGCSLPADHILTADGRRQRT